MSDYQAAVGRVANRFQVDLPGPYDQDWEYIVSDAKRVTEWIAVSRETEWNDVEAVIAITIIIDSYNLALWDGTAHHENWNQIAKVLRSNRSLYDSEIEYWCDDDNENIEDCFAVTPLMKQLRQEINDKPSTH